jgi:hypothetical protein
MSVLQSSLHLQDTLFHGTTEFFRNQTGFMRALIPVTTDSIHSQWVLDLTGARA